MLRLVVHAASHPANAAGRMGSFSRQYREYSPSPELRVFVECFWTQTIHRTTTIRPAAALRVLPDGCIDFVFRLEEDEFSHGAGIVGAMTRPLLVDIHSSARFVGVRFRPGGAFPFVGPLPAGELTDARVPLADLWGNDEVARLGEYMLRFAASLPAAGVGRLAGALQARLAGELNLPAPWLGPAVSILRAGAGEVRIAALCKRFGLSRQHLARVFKAQVGLSPKHLARIFRLRRVLRQVTRERQGGREVNWSALAFEFGYCDQAHLSADCRELTGLSPGRLPGGSEGDDEWLA